MPTIFMMAFLVANIYSLINCFQGRAGGGLECKIFLLHCKTYVCTLKKPYSLFSPQSAS